MEASNKSTQRADVKRGALITGMIVIVILLMSWAGFYSFYKNEQKKEVVMRNDQREAFIQIVDKRDSVINDWILTFNQIERDVQIIKEKENFVTLNSGGELSKDDKTRVLEDMKYINTLIDANKKKLSVLNDQLKKSGGVIKGLQDKITLLDSTLAQNELEISNLKTVVMKKETEITKLDSTVKDMRITIEEKNMTIITQIDELNKAFVITGTFKELKTRGLMTKTGGFIGLGKNKSIKPNFSDSLFTQVDISTIKSILVDARSAKLISEHPMGSYNIIYEGKSKVSRIEITNPQQFWKISKYAVVEIKK